MAAVLSDRFHADPILGGLPIRITLDSGVAVLSGPVDCLLARRRAVEHARQLEGIRAVVDRLEVVAQPRGASDLQKDVVHALATAAETRSLPIHVAVLDGAVVLDGVVEDDRTSVAAEDAAAGVSGVTTLVNRLIVVPASSRGTMQILDPIRLRQQAVGRRDTDAATEQSAPDSSRDAGCERAVLAAFARDDRIPTWPQPQVYVQSGRAVLFGPVATLLGARAAVEDAGNTRCVRRVASQLEVDPGLLVNDEEIEEATSAAMLADGYLRGAVVAVRVSEGVVTLAGNAVAAFQIDRAARIAESVPGALQVVTRLALTSAIP